MRALMTIGVWFLLVLTLVVRPVLAAEEAEEVAPGLKVGDFLDQSNWQLAEGLLPPEVLDHYKRGEYRNRIARAPKEPPRWDKSFEEATKENALHLDVNEDGTIIDKRTGKQPAHYYGLPFPNIDANDPGAAVKTMWNQFVNYWNIGNARYQAAFFFLNPRSQNRMLATDVWFLYFDGQGPQYTPSSNPMNLSMQGLTIVTQPADMQGTAIIAWRYRDPDKRDSVWTFVPALRRVRAVSPANRSDGFLGSDVSQDDGHFFDGKPEDFTWKMIGLREGLRFADARSMAEYIPQTPAPGGGWKILTDVDVPVAGFRTPGWKGVYWAPTDDVVLIKKKMWVVEAIPKDKYYLYGRIELWTDADTWLGAWNRKFSWKGELLNTYQVSTTRNHPTKLPINGDTEWLWNGNFAFQCGESLMHNRATLVGFRATPSALFARRVPVQQHLFDYNSLTRFGK